MNRRRSVFVSLILSLLLVAPAVAQEEENPPMEGFDMAGSDARAIEIADAVMVSLGGRQNWDQTRYLSWSFGPGDQLWDKWTGNFRYQRENQVVLMNILSKEGRAWGEGTEITEAEALQERLDQAYRAWVNSSYWLIMPYKLKDTGVTLKYMGEGTMEDGRAAEVLQLTFKDVGLTPDNKFEVYVDKETMLVGQWVYYRNASDPEPGFIRPWTNWKQYGNVMLSDTRGEGREGPFILPNVGVYDTLPESLFTDPTPVDLATLNNL